MLDGPPARELPSLPSASQFRNLQIIAGQIVARGATYVRDYGEKQLAPMPVTQLEQTMRNIMTQNLNEADLNVLSTVQLDSLAVSKVPIVLKEMADAIPEGMSGCQIMKDEGVFVAVDAQLGVEVMPLPLIRFAMITSMLLLKMSPFNTGAFNQHPWTNVFAWMQMYWRQLWTVVVYRVSNEGKVLEVECAELTRQLCKIFVNRIIPKFRETTAKSDGEKIWFILEALLYSLKNVRYAEHYHEMITQISISMVKEQMVVTEALKEENKNLEATVDTLQNALAHVTKEVAPEFMQD